MRERSTAAENSAITLTDPPPTRFPWLVVDVKARANYELHVRFIDGTEGRVEMREMIFSRKAGVFTSLRQPATFAAVGVQDAAVVWENGLDLAPDAMYDEIKRNGVCVLR